MVGVRGMQLLCTWLLWRVVQAAVGGRAWPLWGVAQGDLLLHAAPCCEKV